VYLHREIREKGGAYGGGASSNVGLWQFYSYRDPHVTKTLETFKNSFDWLKSNDFSDQVKIIFLWVFM
jgi:Zn-dependent M16 (insulinase) family peptidase